MTIHSRIPLGLLFLALFASSALAAPSAGEWARRHVDKELLQPLAKKDAERPRFSRVVQLPHERRLRILANVASYDGQGRAFVPYEIDVRYGDEWRAIISGCAYRKTGQIYVKQQDEYRPAEFLLGEDVKPVKGVCSAQVAKTPRA